MAFEGLLRLLALDAIEPPNPDPTDMPSDRDRAYVETGDGHLERRPEATMLHPARFSAIKPPDTYRVFVVGGSSVFGIGVSEAESLPAAIHRRLAPRMPGKTLEVINAGWVAADSERLRVLVSEVVHYDPDLIVAYTGQNEHFIHYDPAGGAVPVRDGLSDFVNGIRIFRLVDALLGVNAGPKSRWQWGPLTAVAPDDVANFYRENILAMAEACRARDVPLVFSSITANPRSSSRQAMLIDAATVDAIRDALRLELSGALDRAVAAYTRILSRNAELSEAS